MRNGVSASRISAGSNSSVAAIASAATTGPAKG